MVNAVIDILKNKKSNRPHLVVRTYIKGNSNEMIALSEKYQNDDDVIFPTIMYEIGTCHFLEFIYLHKSS